MTKKVTEKKELTESTIKALKSTEKRLLEHNLTSGFALQLTDEQLKRELEFTGSEKTFQSLRRRIKMLCRLGHYGIMNEKGELIPEW